MKLYLFAMALVFAAIIGGVWLWEVRAPMDILDQEYPIWKAKTDMLSQCKPGQVVIIGDSRAIAALAPRLIGADVVNLALGGTGVVEAWLVTKRLLACPKPPRAVIFSMKFSSFNGTEFFWDRSVRLGALPIAWDDLDQLRRRARRDGDQTIFGQQKFGDLEARIKSILYLIRFPSYYTGSLIASFGGQRGEENRAIYDQVTRERGQFYFTYETGAVEKDISLKLDDFDPSFFYRNILGDMVARYTESGVPLYFASPPYNEIDDAAVDLKIKQKFALYLMGYAKASPDFRLIGSAFPSVKSNYFGDSSHTNPDGTQLWSQHFRHLLDLAKVDPGAVEHGFK